MFVETDWRRGNFISGSNAKRLDEQIEDMNRTRLLVALAPECIAGPAGPAAKSKSGDDYQAVLLTTTVLVRVGFAGRLSPWK
jgi:hypothetical protein